MSDDLPCVVFLSLSGYLCASPKTAIEVRLQQNVTALQALGYPVTLITIPDPDGRPPLLPGAIIAPPLPEASFVNFHFQRKYRRQVKQLVERELSGKDTVLFCEHWAALVCAPRHPHLVYSMHDFEAKLIPARRLRKGGAVTWRTRLYWHLAEWLEDRLVRKASHIITVSSSEAAEVRNRWSRPAVYIPTVDPKPAPSLGEFVPGRMRLWFYGSSSATSNKIILDHLQEVLYSPLKAAVPTAEFHQAGSFQRYEAGKLEWLKANFVIHGFVDEPAALFRPGDICLMPYAFDTGFRTKIPEMCSYGVISAGYATTFACCPEMRDGENCIVGADVDELIIKLRRLATDEAWRHRLSEGARETCRRDFSPAALLERYRQLMTFLP